MLNTAPTESRPVHPLRLTFAELIVREPRLQLLLHEAEQHARRRRPRDFCANAVWYGYHGHHGIKRRLAELVGWFRRDLPPGDVLRSMAAYDVAYETIYEALPNCRACGCFRFGDFA